MAQPTSTPERLRRTPRRAALGCLAAACAAIGWLAWSNSRGRASLEGIAPEGGAGAAPTFAGADGALRAAPRPFDADRATARMIGRVTLGGRGVAARVVGWDLGRPSQDAVEARDWGARFRFRDLLEFEPLDFEAWIAPETRTRILERISGGVAHDAEATSDENGAFSLPVVPSDGHWLLVARTERGATGIEVVRFPDGAPREPTEIAIRDGTETLALRVLDADGRPRTGTVRLEVESAKGSVGAIAGVCRLDRDGRAELDHLFRRPHVAIVEWGDRSTWMSSPIDLPHGGEFVLVVGVHGPGVRGIVRGEGDVPLAGAVVTAAISAGGAFVVLRTSSAGDGTFQLEGSSALIRDVGATAPGYEPASLGVRGDESVELRLRPSATIRGRVIDSESGAPVAGVRVIRAGASNRFGFASMHERDFAFTRSGSDGRFTLPASRETTSAVVAYGAGWMSAELDGASRDGFRPTMASATGGNGAELTLRVVRAARLEGTVVDAQGHPVAGATVTLSQSDRMHGMWGDCYRRDPILPFLPDPAPTRTSSDGRFAFDTVKPGLLHAIDASFEGLSRGRSITLDDPGTTMLLLALPAPTALVPAAASPVDVLVTESDGRTPIERAIVELTPTGFPARRMATAADGWARFEDVPGVGGTLGVTADRHAWGWDGDIGAVPAEGAGRRAQTVSLARTYEVRGRVVDPEGRPVTSASVYVQGGGGSSRAAAWRSDGVFVVRDLAAGELAVVANWARDGTAYAGATTAVAGPEDAGCTISLAEVARTEVATTASASDARVTIRVLDFDGKPVAAGYYHARERGYPRSYEFPSSFSGGSFTSDPSALETEVVDVFDARSATGERLGPATTASFTRADAGRTLDVRLERAVAITGRVLGPDGRPVAGVRVLAHASTESRKSGPDSALAGATSDDSGEFRIEGLARERYELDVEVPPSRLAPDALTVVAPAADTTITLRRAARPTITIVDDAGAPVAGATVVVGPPGSISYVAEWDRTLPQTGPRGKVRLDRLDAGATYDVAIEDDTSPPRFLPTRRAGWSPADSTFVVPAPATLSGRVVGSDGEPVARAWVCVVPTESSERLAATASAAVAADGAFAIGMLPRGEHWLRFGVGEAGASHVARATAPAEGLELVADAGPTLVVRFEGVPAGGASLIRALLTTWNVEGNGAEERVSLAPGADGVVRFPGLRKDRRFTLYAVLASANRVGFVADLGLEPSPVTVRLVPGGAVRGTVHFPSKDAAREAALVEVEGRGFAATAVAHEDGAFELALVPPGRWPVRAHLYLRNPVAPFRPGLEQGTTRWSASADASPGDSIDLTLVAEAPSTPK